MCYQNLCSLFFGCLRVKVNEAGSRVLTSVLSDMVFFYPCDQYK